MDFRNLNANNYPLHFIVAVPTTQAELREQIELINKSGWHVGFCPELSEAVAFKQKAKPRFVLLEYNSPSINIGQWVEVLQLPIVLYANGNEPPAEELRGLMHNPSVVGYCNGPLGSNQLYAHIIQCYWASMAQEALREGGMFMAGILEGK